MFTGLDISLVTQGIEMLNFISESEERIISKVSDYTAPNVSETIARAIISYTHFVNKNVWGKPPK